MITAGLADRLKGYYTGKLVTVMTSPMAMSLNEKSFPSWFTVMVDDIDQEAIVGTDITRNTKHVFFFPILGIAEEQMFKPDHPEYEKVKNKMEEAFKKEPEKKPNTPVPAPPSMGKQHISIDNITQQAAALKKKWSSAGE